MRAVLTIAGSDPSGGAGIQGDLKTFHAHGVYGMAVVTALTVQNTTGVSGVHVPPADFLARQLEAVLADMPVHAAKTGMLPDAASIEVVAEIAGRGGLAPLVVDPVMVATSGDALTEAGDRLRILFPHAAVVTPNLPEAEALVGYAVASREAMVAAARDIEAGAVLIKGGHLPGPKVYDVLCIGDQLVEFEDERIETEHSHGTGCALAAAIAARLGRGEDLSTAVAGARAFVRRGLRKIEVLGQGNNPLNHLAGEKGGGA